MDPADHDIAVRDGRLAVEGCDAHGLADRFGTPLYVVSAATLRHNVARFTAAWSAAVARGAVPAAAGAEGPEHHRDLAPARGRGRRLRRLRAPRARDRAARRHPARADLAERLEAAAAHRRRGRARRADHGRPRRRAGRDPRRGRRRRPRGARPDPDPPRPHRLHGAERLPAGRGADRRRHPGLQAGRAARRPAAQSTRASLRRTSIWPACHQHAARHSGRARLLGGDRDRHGRDDRRAPRGLARLAAARDRPRRRLPVARWTASAARSSGSRRPATCGRWRSTPRSTTQALRTAPRRTGCRWPACTLGDRAGPRACSPTRASTSRA